MKIWVISTIIFAIQPQKVAEIRDAVMRKMGLDLVEKPTLTRTTSKDLQDVWLTLKNEVFWNVLTSLPVSHHLSSCYYSLQVLMFSFIFWGEESNEMKVWVLIVRFKLA